MPNDQVDLGKNYYPLEIGKFCIYEVDSIVYDEFTFDSTHYKYQIKEKIEEEFIDIEGRQAYRLMRYIKKYNSNKSFDSIPWSIKDAWQINLTSSSLEVVEENVRFTKLAFPVKVGSTWNGNAKNNLGEWEYRYQYINEPETINSILFAKVSQVTQKNFRTLISWQYYIEKYAKDIGLVYREIIDIKHPVTSVNTTFYNIPDKQGKIYTLKILLNGYE